MRYGIMGYHQSSNGGYLGNSDEDDWRDDYQYDLLTDEEIEQRKRDVRQGKPPEEPEEEDDGLSWCYSTRFDKILIYCIVSYLEASARVGVSAFGIGCLTDNSL